MSRRLAELCLAVMFAAGIARADEPTPTPEPFDSAPAAPRSGRTEGDAAVVGLVNGTVTLAGGTPVAVGDHLALPVRIDATAGSVSLVFEGSSARVLGEGVVLRLHRA